MQFRSADGKALYFDPITRGVWVEGSGGDTDVPMNVDAGQPREETPERGNTRDFSDDEIDAAARLANMVCSLLLLTPWWLWMTRGFRMTILRCGNRQDLRDRGTPGSTQISMPLRRVPRTHLALQEWPPVHLGLVNLQQVILIRYSVSRQPRRGRNRRTSTPSPRRRNRSLTMRYSGRV